MTARSFARRIAHSLGLKPISNADLDCAIWEYTGWPCFWRTKDPLAEFERQLGAAFQGAARREEKP